MADAVEHVADALRARWVERHGDHPAPFPDDLEAWVWRGMAEVAGAAREAVVTDDARARAVRLVDAETEAAGLRAEVEHLKAQVVESTYLRDVAEIVVGDVRDMYPARVYVPGDAEPEYDHDRPLTVVGLHGGSVHRQRQSGEWRPLALSHTYVEWQDGLERGPCIEITGEDADRLVRAIDEDRQNLRDYWSVMWELEREALPDYLLREFEILRDREPAGTVREAKAIVRNVIHLLHRLLGRARSGPPLEGGEAVLTALAADTERARSIAVGLEQELADLRRAIVSIHEPKSVATESEPEDPTIICATCRTDFPCETKAFADALDPVNGLDEFAGQPDPF